MEILHWIGELLQSAGIISGFIFTVHTLRKDTEAQRLANLLAITQQHQTIWKEFSERKDLSRVLDAQAVLDTKPLCHEETLFVTQLILHLDGVHRAIKARMMVNIEGLKKDIGTFFLLPIPKAVWELSKPFQDREFVSFVEECLPENG